jgi:hypothetical protein
MSSSSTGHSENHIGTIMLHGAFQTWACQYIHTRQVVKHTMMLPYQLSVSVYRDFVCLFLLQAWRTRRIFGVPKFCPCLSLKRCSEYRRLATSVWNVRALQLDSNWWNLAPGKINLSQYTPVTQTETGIMLQVHVQSSAMCYTAPTLFCHTVWYIKDMRSLYDDKIIYVIHFLIYKEVGSGM